jgi:hypothetical protein
MALPPQPLIRPVLLRVVAELGGRARPREVYLLVTRHFPDIEPQDLTAVLQNGRTNVWANRIQWARQDLVLAGVLDPAERGVWALTFDGGAIRVARIREDDDRLAGVEAHLSPIEQTFRALLADPEGAHPGELQSDSNYALKTMQNHLAPLKKQGRVAHRNDGR